MEEIYNILKPSEIIGQSSPSYKEESQTWQAQRDLHPKIVTKPETVASLCELIRFLGQSDLDFAVRCQGIGDASARDVLISLANFRDFDLDVDSETITIGGGCTWGEIDAKLEKEAPGFQAVSTRCSFVGVGGSILHGGLSWMSSEFGLASDPQNFLDAQVVTLDGKVHWASEDPDLLWALRGGGSGFGVVTAFKLKIHRYPKNVYSGVINYPRSSLLAVAHAAADFISKIDSLPGTSMYLYNLDLMEGSFIGSKPQPGIGIWVYDSNGEEQGRKTFDWALKIEGAIDSTKTMSLRQINKHGDAVEAAKGVCTAEMNNITISHQDMTAETILRAWDWLGSTVGIEPTKLRTGTFILIEIFQKPVFRSSDPSTGHAWPHTKNQHLIQLGAGRVDGGDYPSEIDKKVHEAFIQAGKSIVGESYTSADHFTNFLMEWNDHAAVYGSNYDRLMGIKRKYDPDNRLRRYKE